MTYVQILREKILQGEITAEKAVLWLVRNGDISIPKAWDLIT